MYAIIILFKYLAFLTKKFATFNTILNENFMIISFVFLVKCKNIFILD